MAGRVRFTSRVKEWSAQTERDLDAAVLQMATDILRVSGILAPKMTRALVFSGRISRAGFGHYKIIYGGGSVPYARRRHFENKKNPGTLRYLERGGESVSNNAGRYFRGII